MLMTILASSVESLLLPWEPSWENKETQNWNLEHLQLLERNSQMLVCFRVTRGSYVEVWDGAKEPLFVAKDPMGFW